MILEFVYLLTRDMKARAGGKIFYIELTPEASEFFKMKMREKDAQIVAER